MILASIFLIIGLIFIAVGIIVYRGEARAESNSANAIPQIFAMLIFGVMPVIAGTAIVIISVVCLLT